MSSSALETDISVSLPAGTGNLVDICASLTLEPGQIFSFTSKLFKKIFSKIIPFIDLIGLMRNL